jgi:gluconate kinase
VAGFGGVTRRIMGVAGCGKSSLAHHLGGRLGYVMLEDNDYHPAASRSRWPAIGSR